MDNLDEVIALIRASKNGKEAKQRLMDRFGFTDVQAQAILDLRLQRLTNWRSWPCAKNTRKSKS